MSYSIKYIVGVISELKEKFNTANPYELCSMLDIILLHNPMGIGSDSCKGFYFGYDGVKTVTLNSDLSDILKKIVLAHELGHSILHINDNAESVFHEFALFDEVSRMEYEANIFAAELLLDDEAVLNLLNEDMSFFQAASKLNVPAELLDFKFRILKKKGYQLIDPPTHADSSFLKKDIGGKEADVYGC